MAILTNTEKVVLEQKLDLLAKGLVKWDRQDWPRKFQRSFHTGVDLHQLSMTLTNMRKIFEVKPNMDPFFQKVHDSLNDVDAYINELQQKPIRDETSRLEIAARAEIPHIIHDVVRSICNDPNLLVNQATGSTASKESAKEVIENLSKNRIIAVVEKYIDFEVFDRIEKMVKRRIIAELQQEVEGLVFLGSDDLFRMEDVYNNLPSK